MFKWFRRFKIVQVEIPKPAPLTTEGKRAMATLKDHPGFEYLLNRTRLQRAALESKLKFEPQDNLLLYRDLQSGVRWLTWLENQYLLAVNSPEPKEVRDPNQEELDALAKIMASFEAVGRGS